MDTDSFLVLAGIPPWEPSPDILHFRRLVTLRFDTRRYGQRWMIETLHWMFKKRFGSFLRARTYWSHMREMMLRLFVFNVLLPQRCLCVLYRARLTPFPP